MAREIILANNAGYELRESQSTYNHVFASAKVFSKAEKRGYLADLAIKYV